MALNLDQLLDTSISDLADLPEFKQPPAGAHRCYFNLSAKEVGGEPALVMNFKVIETLELEVETDKPMEAGDEFDITSTMTNEFGQGLVKSVAAKACAAQGVDPETVTLGQSFEPFLGGEVIAFTGLRVDKKDKSKTPRHFVTLKDIVFDIDAFLAAQEGEVAEQAIANEPEPAPVAAVPAAPKLGLGLGLKLGNK
jgi:hypothetical protein